VQNSLYEPGYYKTSYRALGLRGLIRMRGLLRLPLAYLATRRMAAAPSTWMPQMWADLACTEKELSARFLEFAAPYRQAFQVLGFQELCFKRLKGVLNPSHRDDGGINFLDSSRCHFGQLIYSKSHVRAPVNVDREQVVISFTAVFEKSAFSYSSYVKNPFDSPPNHKVVKIKSSDPQHIYQCFVNDLKRRSEQPRHFPDLESLQHWFDANTLETFNYRVRKGLFVRMTDAEVALARRNIPPPVPRE